MKIGNYTISDKEIDQFIGTLSKEQQMYKDVPQFREQVKERLEEISLFAMEGEEKGLDNTDIYKDTMLIARRDILGQLAMADAIDNIEVTEDEAKEFYEANKQSFAKGAAVTAKHILMATEEELLSVKEEIESGTKTFEEAAKEYSTCPSGKSGGSLGTFGKGQMVKEFEEASFTGELNTIIGPVKTQFGYHLIWVDDRTDASVKSYEEVASQVEKMVKSEKQQEAYDAKVAELRKKYITV